MKNIVRTSLALLTLVFIPHINAKNNRPITQIEHFCEQWSKNNQTLIQRILDAVISKSEYPFSQSENECLCTFITSLEQLEKKLVTPDFNLFEAKLLSSKICATVLCKCLSQEQRTRLRVLLDTNNQDTVKQLEELIGLMWTGSKADDNQLDMYIEPEIYCLLFSYHLTKHLAIE